MSVPSSLLGSGGWGGGSTNPDAGEDDGGVEVGEAGNDAVQERLHVLRAEPHVVRRDEVQDHDLAPPAGDMGALPSGCCMRFNTVSWDRSETAKGKP